VFELSFLPARLMDAAMRRKFEMETRNSKTRPPKAEAPSPAKVGHRVVLRDVEGLLVADIRNGDFALGYTREDWSYLGDGYLVLDHDVGLVHVPSGTEPTVQLGPRPNAAESTTSSDALVARLRERLTAYDGRSPTIPSEAAAQCRDAPGFLATVVQLVADDDRMVSEAATWTLKAELEAGAKLDRALTDDLIARLYKLEAWQAKLHICQAVSHLDVPKTARETLRSWLTPLLDAERPFLRAWALDGLCHLPDTPVSALLDRMAGDPSASVRARVKNLRRQLARRGDA